MDHSRRCSLTTRVLRLNRDVRDVLALVGVRQPCRPAVVDHHRADLDLHRPAIHPTLGLGLDLRSGEEARDERDVEQRHPRPLERHGNGELVAQLHVVCSSREWIEPLVSASSSPARPDRLATISARIETAVSAGVRAPRSRPSSDWTRSTR